MYNEERATYYYQEVLKNPEIFDEHEIAHANICIALAYAMDQSHREEEWLPYAQRAFDIGSIEASTLIGRYYLVEKKEYETAKASKKKNNKTKAIIIISIIAVIVIFSILRNSIRRGHEVQSGGSGESTSGSMNDGSYGDGLSTSEVCNSFNSIVELLNMPSDQIENMLGDAYESSDNTVKYEKATSLDIGGQLQYNIGKGMLLELSF